MTLGEWSADFLSNVSVADQNPCACQRGSGNVRPKVARRFVSVPWASEIMRAPSVDPPARHGTFALSGGITLVGGIRRIRRPISSNQIWFQGRIGVN